MRERSKMRKGQVWVSAIVYTLVSILALVIILNTGIPLLTEMKDRAVFEKVRDIMLDIDDQIRDISNQGEGSQATAAFEVRDGKVKFQDNSLIWELETKSEITSSRTSTKIGNLVIANNANVRTYELADYYVMEADVQNDTFRVVINKKGSSASWVDYNTTEIIQNISFNGENMNGTFTFALNSDPDSETGNGYTQMFPSGNKTDLGRAKVIAHMNSSFADYDLEFVLEGYADFLTVNVKNFEAK